MPVRKQVSRALLRYFVFFSLLALITACGGQPETTDSQAAANSNQSAALPAGITKESEDSPSPQVGSESSSTPPPASSTTPLPPPPSGDWAITASTQTELRLLFQLKPAPIGKVYDLAWSPDGQVLAVSGSSGLVVLDGETLEIIWELETTGRFSSLSFSADSARLAGSDGSSSLAQVWDLKEGKTIRTIPQAGAISAISPDGKMLAAVEDVLEYDASGNPGPVKTILRLFDLSSGELYKKTEASSPFSIWNEAPPETIGIFYSADSRNLQTVNIFGDVRLWNAVNGQMLSAAVNPYTKERLSLGTCQVDGSSTSMFAVACYISYLDPPCTEDTPGCNPVPKGRYEIGLWDASRINRFRNFVFKDPAQLVLNLVLDAANTEVGLLTTNQFDFWSAANTQAPARSFGMEETAPWMANFQSCPSCPAPLLAMKPGGSDSLLAVAYANRILLWDTQTGIEVQSFEHNTQEVTAAALDNKGSQYLLAAGFSDGSLAVLDPSSSAVKESIEDAHVAGVARLSFGRDENNLVSAGLDETIKWWRLGESKPQKTDTFNTYSAFAANQDAGILITSQVTQNQNKFVTDMKLLIQDLQTGQVRQTLEDWGSLVKISLDGNWLASHSSGKINLWDIQKGSLLRDFPAQLDTSTLEAIAVSPDGSLVAGGQSRLFYVQNANTKEVLAQGAIDTFTVSLEFNPAGCLLAAGDLFGRLYLLDIENGEVISQWQAHTGRITHLVFSRDGRILLSVG
ncbi:MAG: WD40 repeat domain-containing protein, partial [Anaerolineae bacterium]|nr:WD40 repeat domain-containing protein [Anaerolineae bacterium]